MTSNGVPFYISFIPHIIIYSLCSRSSGILLLEWNLASSDTSWNNDAPRPYNMTNSKKKGWELSISVSLSLPFSSVRPNSQPSNSTQKLPKAPPPLAASASSDPVSTPSLKQITPWPTSWFRTTLACACASQNYASVFARRFRGISSVRLVTEKYCWQYKIPHINNKRTENWRFFCLLYVTSVCLNMLRQSFKVSVASWPSIKRFFAITIILIFHFFVVHRQISTWFVIKVRCQWLNYFLINVMLILLIIRTCQWDCQRQQQEGKSILRPI